MSNSLFWFIEVWEESQKVKLMSGMNHFLVQYCILFRKFALIGVSLRPSLNNLNNVTPNTKQMKDFDLRCKKTDQVDEAINSTREELSNRHL